MTKPAKIKPFVEGLNISALLSPETEEKTEAKKKVRPEWQYDFENEILDAQEGWIYSKRKNNRKGNKLRKFYERLYGGRGRDEGITFWKPKINDLAYCEAKRWMAVQHHHKQHTKIIGAFKEVTDNAPFCCIRNTEEAPGFAWIVFHKSDRHDPGVSWEWWELSYEKKNKQLERPDCKLRQDIGDAWFAYEERSQQLRERAAHFQKLFMLALEKRYQDEFYRTNRYGSVKRKLIINGREYLIGAVDGRTFGVIVYPEETTVEIVEPGPIPKKAKE